MRARPASLSERALTAELRQVHADLRAANARIVELNATVRGLALKLAERELAGADAGGRQ